MYIKKITQLFVLSLLTVTADAVTIYNQTTNAITVSTINVNHGCWSFLVSLFNTANDIGVEVEPGRNHDFGGDVMGGLHITQQDNGNNNLAIDIPVGGQEEAITITHNGNLHEFQAGLEFSYEAPGMLEVARVRAAAFFRGDG